MPVTTPFTAMPASWFSRRLPPITLIAALLAGCAQPQAPLRPFTAETGPYTARLLVRRGLQPKDVFGVFLLGNAQQCSDSQKLAIGTNTTPPTATIIRAERLTTVSTMITGSEGRCLSLFSFVPRTGRSYAVTVASEDKKCWSDLYDVTDPDNTFAEPSVRKRNAGNAFCRPLGSSTAANADSAPDTPPPSPSAPSDGKPVGSAR
ncbi:MAG: hypothetical protein RLZZ618_2296 [Pseudomonadota bacterium]|jgi:hypothetical protein